MSFLGVFAQVAMVALVLVLGVSLLVGSIYNLFNFFDGDGAISLVFAAACLVGLLVEISVMVMLAGGPDTRPVCGYDHRSKGPDVAVHCDEPARR